MTNSGTCSNTHRGTGRRRVNRRSRRNTAIRLVALSFGAVVIVVFPLYLLVLTALKPTSEAHSVGMTLPTRIAFLDNLATVFSEGNTIRGLINSVLITIPSVTLLLFFGAMAAWVFARGRRHSVKAIYYIAISGVMLPPTIVSTLRVLAFLHLDGSQVGLILFYSGTQLSIAIFLMTGFVKGIPLEIEEAARIDGAGTLRVFWSIIVPSLRPVLLTTGVILTLFIWNDFLSPFFVLPNTDQQTLPLGLYNFASANTYDLNWNLIFTQVLLVSFPLFVLFIFAQRRIVGGLLGGAVK